MHILKLFNRFTGYFLAYKQGDHELTEIKLGKVVEQMLKNILE